MSTLVPFSNHGPVTRRSESRQLSRELSTVNAQARLATARIEASADVQAVRTDAIAYVARRGLQNVGMLTQIEQQLAALVPMASGRLAAIGDMAAVAIAEVVTDTARRIR